MTITKEGFPFIIPSLIAAVVFFTLWVPAGIFFFLLTAFIIYFFRLPSRVAPDGNVVISPADGKVMEVDHIDFDGQDYVKIGIFMSVFNVHVNFAPVSGKVVRTNHKDGQFLPAQRPKSSELNEHHDLDIEFKGSIVRVRQIAGLIARRIVCYKKTNDELTKGERIGLIRFGSKVDVFLPAKHVTPTVKPGDKVQGKSSIIGKITT